MELTIVISVVNIVIVVTNFVLLRRDKSNKDTSEAQYKMGVLETKVDNVLKQIDKILIKLDTYDNEINKKVKEAIEEHILQYHRSK